MTRMRQDKAAAECIRDTGDAHRGASSKVCVSACRSLGLGERAAYVLGERAGSVVGLLDRFNRTRDLDERAVAERLRERSRRATARLGRRGAGSRAAHDLTLDVPV